MRKNVASQNIAAQMNARSDGSPLTTGVSVLVTIDNGTQTAGAGTLTHKGNGHWNYAPTQAETNGNHLAFTFTHASGVHQTLNVYTVSYDPHDTAGLGLSRLDAAITTRLAPTVAGRTLDVTATGEAGVDLDNTAGTLAKGVELTGFNDLSAAGVANAVWDEPRSGHVTAGTFGEKVTAQITAAADFAQAAADKVWSSTTRTLTAFSTALALSVWDVLESAIATASSIGLKLKTNLDATVSSRLATASYTAPDNTTIGTINSKLGAFTASGLNTVLGFFRALLRKDAALTPSDVGGTYDNTTDALEALKDNQLIGTLAAGTHQPQSGDAFARLGAPTGASVSADVAAVQADTNDIQTRLPAALVGGRMDASIGAINNSTSGIAGLARSSAAIGRGTVGAGATTTSIPTSALDPAASVADQFKGRIVIFDRDTTTVALRGQATDITASSAAGVLTVTALTTAPVSGDTFVIV